MGQVKHSPSPWKIEHLNHKVYFPSVIIAKRAKLIINESHDQNMATIRANALLIAAAPDLLACLENALLAISALSTDNDTLLIKEIEAAINKAKGL